MADSSADGTRAALEALFDLSLDLLCIAGTDGRFRRVNPAFERTLGFTAAELTSVPLLDFVHPDDRQATLDEIDKLRGGMQTLRFDNRYRCKDGTYKWLSWSAMPDPAKGLMYAVARDITAWRQSLHALLNDLPGMVYRSRLEGGRTMDLVSLGCRELTGLGPETLMSGGSIAWDDLVHPEDRDRVRSALRNARDSGREYEVEYRLALPDGRVRLVRDRGRPAAGGDGRLSVLQGFVIDVTEGRRLRDELAQMQKMESLGQLTGGVAHDFNNLLSVVIGNLELLESAIGFSERTEPLLRDAMESALRGAELSQRLLAFSRRQMLVPEVISVSDLIRGMESLLARTLGERIEIETDLQASLPGVLVDAVQLENAILNLAINARDAMPEGGRLRISTTRFKVDEDYAASRPDTVPGRYVVIEVADTGSGMTPEVQQRAFEPFFTTKDARKGTGLGLSMVYGFLKQSGGHARIYSEIDHGTSIKLYLPESDGASQTPTGQTQSLLRDSQGRSERILVVEDDAQVRKMVLRTLRELNYETLEADRGAAALALLQSASERIDLLFTDVVMRGGMSGLELADRADAIRPGIKVLLTSGFSEQQAAGASRFPLLTKPYRKVQLAQAVRRALASNL